MHVRRESNPQPAVLETAALPIKLLTYHINTSKTRADNRTRTDDLFLTKEVLYQLSYISLTRKKQWVGEDSNLRRHSRQIYSLLRLTTSLPTPDLKSW